MRNSETVIVVFPSTVTVEIKKTSPFYRKMVLYATMVFNGSKEDLIKYRYTVNTPEEVGLNDVTYDNLTGVIRELAFKGL